MKEKSFGNTSYLEKKEKTFYKKVKQKSWRKLEYNCWHTCQKIKEIEIKMHNICIKRRKFKKNKVNTRTNTDM